MTNKTIIAKKLILIQKNGFRVVYTHVTEIRNEFEKLMISGETDDNFYGMRHIVWDKFEIEDLELMIVEFYVSKTK